jgi:hypothetical protein
VQVAACDSATLRVEAAAAAATYVWGCLDDAALDAYLANQSAVQVTVRGVRTLIHAQ